MADRNSFAGFIITYNRAPILEETIRMILAQSYPPTKLLVMDNSENHDTYNLVNSLSITQLEYYRMGYNAGPSGAAKVALQRLVNEGYEWIYWGDDDDPPVFADCFEKLLSITKEKPGPNIGAVGMVGHHFNTRTGNINRVSRDELNSHAWLMVDSVAGNQSMIVNAQAVKAGALPDADLFFGFEELDFCLRVKKTGFEIKVLTELFIRARQYYGKTNYRQPMYLEKRTDELKRQYYSTRNMLVILMRNGLYFAYAYQVVKAIGKGLYGFRFGFHYGSRNFLMLFKGLQDAISNRLGKKY